MVSIIGYISPMSTARPAQIEINLPTPQERDRQIIHSLIWIDGWTEHRIRSPCRIGGGAGVPADQAAICGTPGARCIESWPESEAPHGDIDAYAMRIYPFRFLRRNIRP